MIIATSGRSAGVQWQQSGRIGVEISSNKLYFHFEGDSGPRKHWSRIVPGHWSAIGRIARKVLTHPQGTLPLLGAHECPFHLFIWASTSRSQNDPTKSQELPITQISFGLPFSSVFESGIGNSQMPPKILACLRPFLRT